MQMDDPSICDDGKWSKDRYDDIVSKLTPFLRSCGYNPAKDFVFCPLAALTGGNVLRKPAAEVCDWWDGPTLFEALDSTDAPPRDPMASFRMPIMDKYKDMGTVVMGKSESGVVQVPPRSACLPVHRRKGFLSVLLLFDVPLLHFCGASCCVCDPLSGSGAADVWSSLRICLCCVRRVD